MKTSDWITWVISTAALIVAELAYFKIADRFNIIDRPNQRSSHASSIIRGGGIIFLFAILLWFFQRDFQWPYFVAAVALTAAISFLDDIGSLNAGIRFIFHLLAVVLLMFQLWPLPWSVYLMVIAVIVCIGTLNAFNFMDGINGITGVYSLVTLISFACIDRWVIQFTDFSLLVTIVVALLIFLFFNFRKKALCFAGDVGSVSIALILIFILLQLIRATGNFLWPMLFLVYGTDAVITIVYRLMRKENIFKAHRSHLYQYLSNEIGLPHLWVSSGYGIAQALINVVLVIALTRKNYILIFVMTAAFVTAYFVVRQKVLTKIEAKLAKG